MKLTTKRLKKLIREELSKVSEAADMDFEGDSYDEQPISISENGDVNIMFSVNGDPDYEFIPKALNKEKLKSKPIPGMAQAVGDIILTIPKQKFKIGKDGKFAVKSKDGQTVIMQIPRDQMQEL